MDVFASIRSTQPFDAWQSMKQIWKDLEVQTTTRETFIVRS